VVFPEGVNAVVRGVVFVVGFGAFAVVAFNVFPVVAADAASVFFETNHLRVTAK